MNLQSWTFDPWGPQSNPQRSGIFQMFYVSFCTNFEHLFNPLSIWMVNTKTTPGFTLMGTIRM